MQDAERPGTAVATHVPYKVGFAQDSSGNKQARQQASTNNTLQTLVSLAGANHMSSAAPEFCLAKGKAGCPLHCAALPSAG
jgi:hypothetical protein